MSQDASAGQSKRSPNQAYALVYHLPTEGEEEKRAPGDLVWTSPGVVLVILLAAAAVLLFLREKGSGVSQLNPGNSFGEERILRDANDDYRIPPVTSYARVAAGRLYLRAGPGTMYEAIYLLPKNWGVSLIGDYRTDDYGEVWARILVQTNDGPQEGWVSRRYLE
ncbi:MAG TPA: SH3 domain-containing protein [Blastocatellia bacterium]|jgi:hypothetical protein